MPADDRQGVERLVRYTARPAVSDQRLSKRRDGKVVLQLLRPWADGTTQIVFDPRELIEKLAALVPRPMANLVRYHGYLAPAAPWRAEIVPATPEPVVAQPPAITSPDYDPACQLPAEQGPRRSGRWIPWATLLHRVFGFEVLDCESCGGRMALIATIRNHQVVSAILDCLGLDSSPPEIAAPAHEPCQLELFPA